MTIVLNDNVLFRKHFQRSMSVIVVVVFAICIERVSPSRLVNHSSGHHMMVSVLVDDLGQPSSSIVSF